jgi:soluble lytic murein transglycosylase-like protein
MQRFLTATLVLLCGLGWSAFVRADPPPSAKQRLIDRVCNLIQAHADQNGLPRDFFARLIWKESRFDPNAVSPVGAEGIAQFMPGTAKMRGLANSFDIDQAIPASAKYLAEMKTSYGNLGLAAAAYNAGPGRVQAWLRRGGALPRETQVYVWVITQIRAEEWIGLKDLPEHRMGRMISCDAVAKLLLSRTRKRQEPRAQSQAR